MPSEFHCFMALPPELRIIIWREASYVAREVELKGREHDETSAFRFQCASSPPAVLHVNNEARHEGLKVYKTIASNASSERDISDMTAPYFHISVIDSVTLTIKRVSTNQVACQIVNDFLKAVGDRSIRVECLRLGGGPSFGSIVKEMLVLILILPWLREISVGYDANTHSHFIDRSSGDIYFGREQFLSLIRHIKQSPLLASTISRARGNNQKLMFQWLEKKIRRMQVDTTTLPDLQTFRFGSPLGIYRYAAKQGHRGTSYHRREDLTEEAQEDPEV